MKSCSRHMLLLLSLLLLPGCWDRTEINDLAFILVSGLDLEPDGKLRYTVMVPLPGQMGGASGGGGGTGGEKSYYIDSEVGDTVREAQMKLQKRMSRRMFLAHRRTILLGESLAKNGVRDLFDSTPRSPESRMTTYVIVTKGKAYEMLQSTPKFERFPSEAIRELSKSRAVADTNFKDFALALSSPGGDPVAIYMNIKKSEKSEKPSQEVEVKGYAQFKDDKMIGTFEDDAAQGLSWLRSQLIMTSVTLNLEEQHLMTLKVDGTKAAIKVNLLDGKINFAIHVKAKAKMMEDRSYYDLNQAKNILKVEEALSAYVKKAIQSVIDKSIKNQADSAQLGSYVWKSYPDEWKNQFEKNWPQSLKEAKFTINVESELNDIGLIYDNVTKEN
jgi:spore germination protein KC